MTVAEKITCIIRKSSSDKQTICAKCGELMLMAEQIAAMFDVTQRRIFQLIETKAVHYAETATGSVLVCLPSPAEITSGETRKD